MCFLQSEIKNMFTLHNEINVMIDKLYLFLCSKSALCVTQSASFIDVDQPRDVWIAAADAVTVKETYSADVLFLALGSWYAIPSVTFLTAFMGQQVAEQQQVTQAVLIMWANKSAVEEMSASKRYKCLHCVRMWRCIVEKKGFNRAKRALQYKERESLWGYNISKGRVWHFGLYALLAGVDMKIDTNFMSIRSVLS